MREYGRGICGGLMFALPLLYTMEVWDAGALLAPTRILAYAAGTFGILLLYNRFSGLRHDATWTEVAIDSVEEMGIGVVLAAAILWMTGRITPEATASETVGMIMMEAMIVAIGVSVGTAQLGAPDDGDEGLDDDSELDRARSLLPQLALALCGAVLFATNIAPTDEVPLIAAGSSPERLASMAAFSILLGVVIVRFADFRNAAAHASGEEWTQTLKIVAGSYVVALGASLASLWFFGRTDGEPFAHCVAMTVVLSFPANLGACAGRLLLQNSSAANSPSDDKEN